MCPWYYELFHASLWDWGDVATWFTGIVTAGTFWLGFTILRSDRKKEERLQAFGIVGWDADMRRPYTRGHRIVVRNASAQPVMDVALWGRLWSAEEFDRRIGKKHYQLYFSSDKYPEPHGVYEQFDSTDSYLEPGDMREIVLDSTRYFAKAYELLLVFIDGSGVMWRRDIHTGRLSKMKDLEAWRDKYWKHF